MLSSLTHTTPHAHTQPGGPSLPADDGDEESGVPEAVNGRPPSVDFYLAEFLALANRVVDVGDEDSFAALSDLKRRWMTKLGDEKLTTPVLGLKPVASRRPTPFQPPVRELRRPIRTLIPADSPLPPPPLLTMSGGASVPVAEEGTSRPAVTAAARVLRQPTTDDRETTPLAFAAEPEADGVEGARPECGAGGGQHIKPPHSKGPRMDGSMGVAQSTAPAAFIPAPTTNPPASFFVGKVPITPKPFSVDTITDAFHNSSRKTLSYIPPTAQNGETIVRPSLDMIRNGAQRWATTAVGYFLGKRPYFHHVNEFARSVWPMVREVKATANGFFFFEFKTMAAMEEVIEGGPWLFHGQAIVLQKWEPGMVLRKLQHTQVPVWIKLRHLPVELWTTEGLSMVASGVGKPLYPDAITLACTRLDFARVCVMLDISAKLLKHIVIMIPKEDGSEVACKVDVEYEWLPPKCTTCHSLGHAIKDCPTTKPRPQPVSVFVQKPTGQQQNHRDRPTDVRTQQPSAR
ncbi:UNVERIFIED_CONTAM: hypothetical protein Sradi_7216200 [Sesamum radiatum]|uniref:DUF4283 domain-containing protein n=1 Tax=Sesamum radiatum TaxID=300843 RepID=A0AAW2IP85_SESRA